MDCAFCGGELKKTTVTFSYEEDETYILVKHVPSRGLPKMWGKALYARSHGGLVAVCQTAGGTS